MTFGNRVGFQFFVDVTQARAASQAEESFPLCENVRNQLIEVLMRICGQYYIDNGECFLSIPVKSKK